MIKHIVCYKLKDPSLEGQLKVKETFKIFMTNVKLY